ncbi:MAG: 6-hydroxymethylpterin diphosphokinase MptE-like protein [Gammaproteobacteria bacterium]|jgi:hypothetical protein
MIMILDFEKKNVGTNVNKVRKILKEWLVPPGIWNLGLMLKRKITQVPRHSPEQKMLLDETRQLKDKHKGQRCFILGAGPSVLKQDLTKIKDEMVISVSNTFVHKDYAVIKSAYHVTPHLLFGHGRYYSNEEFSIWLKDMEKKTFDAEMFFHIKDKKIFESNNLFSNRNVHWVDYSPWEGEFDAPIDPGSIPHIWSVSELAISLAVYMGFEKIYLLGIDHDWFNGITHFYNLAKENKLVAHKSSMDVEKLVDAEFQMRRHAEIFHKYKYLYSINNNIFNANADPNHYLDVFPKVNYESLFI